MHFVAFRIAQNCTECDTKCKNKSKLMNSAISAAVGLNSVQNVLNYVVCNPFRKVRNLEWSIGIEVEERTSI